MLKLFAARENIDKERFLYEHVSGETLILVPNQYTLVAEEQAIRYLDTKCLFDVEVLSMNRLGLRVLTEQGLESTKMLDQYGRFMLLNRIIKFHKDELNTFANSVGKLTFASMVNDFISDFKQQNCSLEEVREMLSSEDADGLLKDKLEEFEVILDEYEKAIEGKYTDSEDYIAMYVDAIGKSEQVLGKKVWIYGYDSITPKFMNAMFELAGRCDELNFIVNKSDFELDKNLVRALLAEGNARGVEVGLEDIPETYALAKSETIAHIEQGLFNDELSEAERERNAGFVPEDLTVVRAANPYYEAESAACYIYHLVRDLGYRMRDIQVIANDEGTMQPIIRRTFEEYGLPVFMDQSRSITDAAPVNFIVNMLWFLRYESKTDALMAMLKTGMAGVAREQIELLENYARTYRIKGSMWSRPFKYGAEAYGERFAEIEQMREALAGALTKMDDMTSGNVAEFVAAFKEYLNSEWQLAERVQSAADLQVKSGLLDDAQRSIESYKAALTLLDQMVEIMGDEALDIAEFVDIYMTGLTNVEVGVIPPTADGLSMGTMIRTRPREPRAVVILGANEGTLPMQPSPEGLFSVDEKAYFKGKGFALGVLDDIKMDEEQVAMYRMMSKPSEKLYISYAMTDADGKEAAASSVIDALTDLYPRLEKDGLIKKDVISSGWSDDMIQAESQAMRHLFNHLKDRKTGAKMDGLTEALMSWYENNNSREYVPMLETVKDMNNPKALGAELAKGLYASKDGSFKLSASSIGNYFDCPFKYFVNRGLRPEEERDFAGDARSIGDVYHQCLMQIANRIVVDKGYAEALINCSEEDLQKIVEVELKKITAEYREGLFESNEVEEYRMTRILEVCSAAAKAMAIQLNEEDVTGAKFEEGFGRGRTFKPVELEVNGVKFFIEGQIDRVDFMNEDSARVIDYKTGSDKLDLDKLVKGYKMQLMIYMMSVVEEGYEPAGMFYFNIFDPIEAYNDKDETKVNSKTGKSKQDEEKSDAYKLKGAKLDRALFDSLKASVDARITEIADGISSGKIDIDPYKDNNDNNKLVCNYCDYRYICRRR